jgi:hypothetical protein
MRLNKRRSALSGAIDFPIVPIVLVICLVLLILGRQAWENVSFVSGFKLMPEDVQSSSQVAISAKQMNFTLQLTPVGSAHLANYINMNPNTDIPLVYSGTYLGTIKGTPGMDTRTLRLVVDNNAGMMVRLKLDR